jgi:DNA-binding transcriptional LysR family regulator
MRTPAHQLEYFVAVCEEGQFTRAASRLRVAQPSVSAQIRELERSLGTSLFHRGAGPVSVTDAGKQLLPLARRVLHDLDEIEHEMAALEGLQRGHVAIGATPSLSGWLLPPVLGRFHEQFPGISLKVTEQRSRRLVAGLESGELDLALVILPLNRADLESKLLATEELVVVTARNHHLARRSKITINDLRYVPLVMFSEGYDLRKTTLEAFNSCGLEPTVAVEGGEMGSVLALVAEGVGAAIVPSIVANDTRLSTILLRSPKLDRQVGLVRRSDRVQSRASAALSTIVAELVSRSGWVGPVPNGFRLELK